LHITSQLFFKYQPIINAHTGATYALEASLHGYNELGFDNLDELSKMVYKDKAVEYISKELRQKALFYFKKANQFNNLKLFYNIDTKNFENFQSGIEYTLDILKKLELKPKSLVIKINDSENILSVSQLNSIIEYYQSKGIKVALNNISKDICPQMLTKNRPDYIVVDQDLLKQSKKDKEIFNYIKDMTTFAKNHGILVYITGIEDDTDYYCTKDLKTNLIKGDFFQEEIKNIKNLKSNFIKINNLNRIYRKEYQNIDNELVYDSVNYLEPIIINKHTTLIDVIEYFKKNTKKTFIPIVDKHSKPIGIIREENLKNYVYSTYGLNILTNDINKNKINKYIDECSIVDIHTDVDDLLNIFVTNENMEGLMVTEEEQYIGFLSAKSLLKIIFEKKLSEEADKNPLTKLPGNKKIEEYINKKLKKNKKHVALIYFDFDYFKPFNDKYGFSKGDEAISIFADILREKYTKNKDFIAHIGGDDFFAGISIDDFEDSYNYLRSIIVEFENITKKFYTRDEIQQQYYFSKDREGFKRKFNLLSISAVVVELSKHSSTLTIDDISSMIATAKKSAKLSIDKIVSLSIL
jgi:diguanylate cyclase (GGDEF)-like protein